MAVARATEHRVEFYHSSNLREWQHSSMFGPAGATGGVWECPVLMRVPVDGEQGQTRWMLKVDLNPGHPAGGSGAQYFVGDFDGERFVPADPEPVATWVDHGPDFYCAQPWLDANTEGAGPWIGWMSNWNYAASTPTGEWRGAMTLPRRLHLREVDNRLHLTQHPIRSLEGYRGVPSDITYENQIITDVTPLPASMSGALLDLELTIDPGETREVGLLLRRSDREHVLVAYDPVRRVISLDRRPSGDPTLPDSIRRAFHSRHEAARLRRDEPLVVRVVVDRSSVELFADDGEVVLTALVFPSVTATGLALFSKGGPVRAVHLRSWPLRAPLP
jgi:fructan beta-fructosidase